VEEDGPKMINIKMPKRLEELRMLSYADPLVNLLFVTANVR